MKYRLVELLKCPSDPDEFLRVAEAQVSEVFPYSGDLRPPVCRAGCGLLGNWFADIPEALPVTHRFDCRRCLGMEIETARIVCPGCGWSLEVSDGVLRPPTASPAGDPMPEGSLPQKIGTLTERLLDLKIGDLALVLAPLPASTLERWGCNGIERLHVELDPETLMAHRARSCANGQGLVHHLAGPMDAAVFRSGRFDAVISLVPPDRLAASQEALGLIPSLLRPAGRILLLFPRQRGLGGSGKARLDRHHQTLPESYHGFHSRLVSGPQADLVLLSRPKPSRATKPKIAL